MIDVGIYNGDIETVTTVSKFGGEDIVTSAGDLADPYYSAQAVFTMDKETGTFEIDASENGAGTYYVEVSTSSQIGQTPYRLTITTDIDDVGQIDNPPSQLVWLSFGDIQDNTNATADFLDEQGNSYFDIVNRPDKAFFHQAVTHIGQPVPLALAFLPTGLCRMTQTPRATESLLTQTPTRPEGI